jgi:bifunctional oligoribonuclease and PAP phosphatase NrnA
MSKQFIKEAELEKIQKWIQEKPCVAILAHSNPDGDTIGCTTALALGLEQLKIKVQRICIDPVPNGFKFLEGANKYVEDFDVKDFDSAWFCDCGDKVMTRFHEAKPEILSDSMTTLNLDHHPTNDNFGDINFVDSSASSSCEITLELLQKLNLQITPEIATALLLGLYTDTGGFQHQNTTPEAYRAAATLIRAGGNVAKIAKHVFHNNEFRKFKLWGKVLKNLHLTEDGAAIIGAHVNDYQNLGATRQDLGGVIDWVSSMPEAQYSVLLSEDEKGNVKASLRTRKADIDVKALAEKFGGGGHVKAAGFTVRGGHLKKEVKWKIVTD